jgi:hypothetical protein
MSATAPNPILAPDEDQFRAWLSQASFPGRIAKQRKHGQYYLLAIDFNVAGVGTTIPEAERDLARLLRAYFGSYFREGRPFEDAIRPARWRTRLAVALGTFVLQRIGSAVPHECSECEDDLPGVLLGHAG